MNSGFSPIKPDNVYFANYEQALLVFSNVHAEHNLIELRLYSNWSAEAVNNILASIMWNSSKPIKFPHLWKLANQSTSNKAHVIEITKACKVTFMKERDSSVIRYRENVWIGEKNRTVEIYSFKLPANGFWLKSKICSWFNKVVYSRPSIKWTLWKGNDL